MKNGTLLYTLAAAFTLGLASCGQKESATLTAEDANRAASSTAGPIAKATEAAQAEAAKATEATEAAEAVKSEAAKAADAAKAEAAKTAEMAKAVENGKPQGCIDRAKGFVVEGKFSDASSALEPLAGQFLSSDQATLVDGLREQIRKALVAKSAQDAATSVSNLLRN